MDLTQAAVSQHISRLEAEFGPLLLRKPRLLELTRAAGAARLRPPAGAGRRTAAGTPLGRRPSPRRHHPVHPG
ncbi:LysR family transcriptional regulator [Aeromonas veronii]